SNQRSAFKCKRTFDRAGEPGPLTPPLEVRLEMRSVCAVALSPTEAPRYGSASRTVQQSDEHASRRRRASAAGLLVFATAVPPNSPMYTLRAGAEQALLAFGYLPRPPLPYFGASVVRKAQRTLTA